MIHRLYTERKDLNNPETLSLLAELQNISGLKTIRILNRYDIQGLNDEMLEKCRFLIFADPLSDNVLTSLPDDADKILAVEYLPGQYDQRADAAEQCALLLLGFRPVIKTAKIYLFYGDTGNFEAVRKHLINPVEAREARLGEYENLRTDYPEPEDVKNIDDVMSLKNLAMSAEDLECIKKFFDDEGRKPTETEIKVLDTYWSDHCRHTTFTTHIDGAEIEDEAVKNAYDLYMALRSELGYPDDKPVTLMDIATIGAKYHRHKGLLPSLVISEENNACTVRIDVDGEKWLLLFKNETHNHPTEIEPFGGAATCIGGAIRDPLSGRAYVYQAMRITGAADPSAKTIDGKLPQRVIMTKAAQGYSSYGNQIGLPTGLVHEFYHEGYRAKRLEVGAVIAAVRESQVIRENPEDGDVVLLLGGKTGRDGIGGATGSSVSHTSSSVETCGAEVQKGNAPEERKLQRLFRNPEFTRLIKRCNDFGAGGVSVAVGELADGLDINLDAVPLKYAGLDGTEIAVSESQERMAVVVSPENAERVKFLAFSEDVEAAIIARVDNSGRLKMSWRGREIVNISRSFINTHGSHRHTKVKVNKNRSPVNKRPLNFPRCLDGLNTCSKRGLSGRFDSTVGSHTVLMPLGGKFQKTPVMAMCSKIPVSNNNTDTCSLMSFGFDPFLSEISPFDGAYIAVLESLCKIIAAGGNLKNCWLTLQEYFGKPEHDPERWGLPFAALLGALKAQIDYGVSAIGGKDSMSGTFIDDGKILDVPPTLISFAVSVSKTKNILSPEFKQAGSRVIILRPEYDNRGLPLKTSVMKIFADLEAMNEKGKILACSVLSLDGMTAEVFRMCLGNNLGFFVSGYTEHALSDDENLKCTFIAEIAGDEPVNYPVIGRVISSSEIISGGLSVKLSEAEKIYDAPLSGIFPVETAVNSYIPDVKINSGIHKIFCSHAPISTPHFLIPVFAGTNCEYETADAVERAGGKADILVIRTSTPGLVKSSAEEFSRRLMKSQGLVIPGGFSNSDEPDGSGKFIAIFLRSPEVRRALENLLNEREGLICGICNGFQALIKTGLLPHGKFMEPEELTSTLTFNRIGRHQSRIIRTRVVSNKSAWMRFSEPGEIYSVPISHGEGRFRCSEEEFSRLMKSGQIAGQYVDFNGLPSMETQYNPSGSDYAVECLTSPDGRIIGRMGHVERCCRGLYKNVPGNYDIKFFEAACYYFNKKS